MPRAVNNVLKRHPKIADIGIARVKATALEHEAWVGAVAKETLTLNELNNWVRSSLDGELASGQFHRLEIVEKVPRTETGKVARADLHQMLLRASVSRA